MFVLNNLFTEIGKQKSNPILSSHKKQLMHLTFVKKNLYSHVSSDKCESKQKILNKTQNTILPKLKFPLIPEYEINLLLFLLLTFSFIVEIYI